MPSRSDLGKRRRCIYKITDKYYPIYALNIPFSPLEPTASSQGLRSLRELGAVREAEVTSGRRVYYEPDVELKRLVGGFIKEQVRPHLSSGEEKLDSLKKMVGDMPGDVRSDFYAGRLERLSRWSSRAKVVLPLLQKFLGS